MVNHGILKITMKKKQQLFVDNLDFQLKVTDNIVNYTMTFAMDLALIYWFLIITIETF